MAAAARGAVNSVSAMSEIVSPQQTITDVSVSGLPAKRVSYSAMADGSNVFLELISFAKGQHMWTVEVIYQARNRDARAEAIINSVRLK